VNVVRNLILAMIFLLFSSSSVFAETWDFGIGIPYSQGRMKNYNPLQLEIGAASVKGYGVSASAQSTKDHTAQGFTGKLKLTSYDIHLFYRFEKYVHRWDVGVMTNLNKYYGQINEIEFNKDVTYTGPMAQYSTTIQGYDREDVYYGVRFFIVSTSKMNTNSFDLTDDTTFQSENENYKSYIKDNNPASVIGLNITIGWRL
jgi:hypothetical protein